MAIINLRIMKQIMILFWLLISIGCFGQQTTRELKAVTFSGNGYKLGLQHGMELKKEINEIILEWKRNTANQLGKDADIVLKDFFEYAEFDDAIKKWTPDLYEEVKGIADG